MKVRELLNEIDIGKLADFDAAREEYLRNIFHELADSEAMYEADFSKKFKFNKGKHPNGTIKFATGSVTIGFVTDNEIEVTIYNGKKVAHEQRFDITNPTGKDVFNIKDEDEEDRILDFIADKAADLNPRQRFVKDDDDDGEYERAPQRESPSTLLQKFYDSGMKEDALTPREYQVMGQDSSKVNAWIHHKKKPYPDAEAHKKASMTQYTGISIAASLGERNPEYEEKLLAWGKSDYNHRMKTKYFEDSGGNVGGLLEYAQEVIKGKWPEAEKYIMAFPKLAKEYEKLK